MCFCLAYDCGGERRPRVQPNPLRESLRKNALPLLLRRTLLTGAAAVGGAVAGAAGVTSAAAAATAVIAVRLHLIRSLRLHPLSHQSLTVSDGLHPISIDETNRSFPVVV